MKRPHAATATHLCRDISQDRDDSFHPNIRANRRAARAEILATKTGILADAKSRFAEFRYLLQWRFAFPLGARPFHPRQAGRSVAGES